MKKETPVQWLLSMMEYDMRPNAYYDLFNEARKLENQLIKETYAKGILEGLQDTPGNIEKTADSYFEKNYSDRLVYDSNGQDLL